MQFSLFDVIVLIGILQGIIASIQLTISSRPGANKLLAWILVITVLLNCKILLHTLGLWDMPLFHYFPLAVDLTIQPLLYLYIVSITQPFRKLRRPTIFHLVPSFLLMGHALIVYGWVFQISDLSEKGKVATALAYDSVKEIEDYLSVLSFGVYLFLSIRQLKMYRSWLLNTSDNSYPIYGWLRNLLLLMSGLTLLLLGNIVLDYGINYGQANFFHWQLFYFLMTGIIYYIGFQASKQINLPQQTGVAVPRKTAKMTPVSPEKLQQIGIAIEVLLKKEKIYLNPTITLAEMARQLDVSSNVLSFTISKSYEKSFRDLINEYRVAEVKDKLIDDELSHLSILGIALDSGFNSEASFYRVFKKHENRSPKEFQEQHR